MRPPNSPASSIHKTATKMSIIMWPSSNDLVKKFSGLNATASTPQQERLALSWRIMPSQLSSLHCSAVAGHCRATLTSAASKFPLKIVFPGGVVTPAAGFATAPATSASTPSTTARVPLGADNLAEAASNEYGGAV